MNPAGAAESDNLPRGWAKATVSDVLGSGLFVDGDWVESKDQDPKGDVRLIQLADVGDGVYRNRSNRFLTRAKAAELKCTFLVPGDILFARMPDPLGRACVFPGDSKPSVTVVDVCILRPSRRALDGRWLMNTLNSPTIRSRVAELQSGSTRQRISRKNLSAITVPLPPLLEQRRIVEKLEALLSDVDAAIRALEGALERLKRYRQAVLKTAVEGELSREWREAHGVAPGRPESGSLPMGWERIALGEAGTVSGGLTKNPKRDRCRLRLPYLRVANVYAGELRLDDLDTIGLEDGERERVLLKEWDLLVVEGNGSRDQIGRVALWDGSVEPCVHQNHIIKVRFVDSELSRWSALFLLSPAGRDQIRETASSTSGLYTLSISKVGNLLIAIPSPGERSFILDEVNRLFSIQENLAVTLRADLLRTVRLRRSILEKAFRGELVPQDPNDEPASVLLERVRAERAAAAKPKAARSREARAEATAK